MSGKTSAESINKYMKKAYTRITVLCKPDQEEEIKQYAKNYGMSVTQFILYCVTYTTLHKTDKTT